MLVVAAEAMSLPWLATAARTWRASSLSALLMPLDPPLARMGVDGIPDRFSGL
jgi:hypothetical protein